MVRVVVAGSCSLFVLLLSAGVLAAPDDRPVEVSAGALLLAGGNLLSEPDNVPGGYEGLGFAGDGGGFGWGAFAYGEGRFFRHLGLEMHLGLDQSTVQRSVTYSGAVDVTERLQLSTVRLGFLLKGILPVGLGRLWAGLGPELVLSSSADAENEITGGAQFIANRAEVEDAISVTEESSTLLSMGLGMVIHAGDLIEIPIQLTASRNLSDESDWTDRVALDTTQLTYEVDGRSSWEFRLGAGVGVRF